MFFSATALAHASPGVAEVDPGTLTGKVMCGYQGWFNATGDGAGRGYHHWSRSGKRKPCPDTITFDLWPDLSEFPEEERFPTEFQHADGSTAEVFSSFLEPTVHRHFEWMRDYGIHGVFLQRFIHTLDQPQHKRHNDTVLAHVRGGAEKTGRVFAMMYDTSGLGSGQSQRLLDDWRELVTETRITESPRYLNHKGRPLLAIWGCGFRDDKNRPSLDDWEEILTALRTDPTLGNPAVMLGVPTFWRELRRDSLEESRLHEILAMADVISPWTVGRYRDPGEARRHAAEIATADIAWCEEHNLDYLPVAFPGFSWHHLQKRHGRDQPVNSIPRRRGEFLQSQIDAYLDAGAEMLYVAMFDEVDEGTAIFKCTNHPPVDAPFATFEGLPSDHYLKLTGRAARRFEEVGRRRR